MRNVLVKLKEYTQDASIAEKGLVDHLLSAPDTVVGCSIQELSRRAFCSPSTIVRLCKRIGFTGYKEMQMALIQDLALEHEHAIDKTEEISKNDTLDQIITKITYKNMVSLENTRKLLDTDVLQKSLDMLAACKTIYLFGLGSSLLVAHDAYLKLLRIDKPCMLSDDWHAQLLQAMNIHSDDLALIISYSGGTEEMLRCAREIKKRGAPILAITRSDESPLAKLADVNLSVASSELLIRTGAMSSRISQLNIIDIVYVAYINRSYKDSMKQLQRTSIRKITDKEEDLSDPFSDIIEDDGEAEQ